MTGLSINDDEAEEVVKAVASFGRRPRYTSLPTTRRIG
jgi:hypothetical protein